MLSLADIKKASARIDGYVHETPLLTCELLNKALGHKIYFKAECLQKIGAFKARGALNSLLALQESKVPINHIVANSSGNHAQAIAWSAKQLGLPATIYMPKNVSKIKALATKSYGAEVVLGETRAQTDRQVEQAAEGEGVHWIPPFNHKEVICGQGTATLEAIAQLKAQGDGEFDAVVAPCGGGGLLSGTYIAAKGLTPNIKVIGAEPLAANDAVRSVKQGSIVRLEQQPISLADGAMTLAVGDITFEYLKKLDAFYEVEEQAIAYWTQWLSHLLKLHIETTSAMAMGAVLKYLQRQKHLQGQASQQQVLVILSGGNVDKQKMQAVWQQDHLQNFPSLEVSYEC